MRPRTEVSFLSGDLTIAEARRQVRDGPYSRYPIIDKTPDDVLGFIHVRDLMPRDGKAEYDDGPMPFRIGGVPDVVQPGPDPYFAYLAYPGVQCVTLRQVMREMMAA